MPETPKFALPSRDAILAQPWLKPLAGRLADPQLWRLNHESVARGAAVGVFWAFAIPVAQIVLAVVHCTIWRANIPVAAGMTMITNPLTLGFWLWLAYQVGAVFVGPDAAAPALDVETLGWWAEYGVPTLLGMGTFALGGAAVAYLAVQAVWRLRVHLQRRRRIGAGRRHRPTV